MAQAQTINHLSGIRIFMRVVASFIPDAQYNYKDMSICTEIDADGGSRVYFVVSGRKGGKPFSYERATYNSAVDKYNSIVL